MHLAVAGAGFVGLATATGFARQGYHVVLFDIDREKLACLRAGTLPFAESSLEGAFCDVLGETLEVDEGPLDGRVRPAGFDFDFVFNCVGTPPRPDGTLDLTAVREVVTAAITVTGGRAVVVNRSTVPPGTAAAIESELRESHPTASVVANPEFLREGSALYDFDWPARRVIGGSSGEVVEAVRNLYSFSDAPIVTTDATSAELIKVGANAALAVRVSMANEIADVAGALGVDAETVLSGIGADPRIGHDYLSPGIGFGGMCLPKDLDAYRAAGRAVEARTHVFDGAAETNNAAPGRLADRVIERMNGAEARVCVVGLGFKRGSDQTRGSRAMLLVEALLERRVPVSVYDPLAERHARQVLGDRVQYLPTLTPLPDGHRVVVFTQGPDESACAAFPEHVVAIDGTGQEIARRERSVLG